MIANVTSTGYMRYLLYGFFWLIAPMQANACVGAISDDTLFFDAAADAQPRADVIAKVTLLDVSLHDAFKVIATARIQEVLRSSDHSLHQGSIITLKYLLTSCGPNNRRGSEGTIMAKARSDGRGLLVLYPFMRRHSDSRISNSCVNESNGEIKSACK